MVCKPLAQGRDGALSPVQRCRRPCTCTLRVNITGSPADLHRDKKVCKRGPPWPPSDSLTLVIPSTLAVWMHVAGSGPRLVLLPPLCMLIPPLAAATTARGRAALRASSRHGPSAPPPSLASEGTTLWPILSCAWAQTIARAGVRWHEAGHTPPHNSVECELSLQPYTNTIYCLPIAPIALVDNSHCYTPIGPRVDHGRMQCLSPLGVPP